MEFDQLGLWALWQSPHLVAFSCSLIAPSLLSRTSSAALTIALVSFFQLASSPFGGLASSIALYMSTSVCFSSAVAVPARTFSRSSPFLCAFITSLIEYFLSAAEVTETIIDPTRARASPNVRTCRTCTSGAEYQDAIARRRDHVSSHPIPFAGDHHPLRDGLAQL